MRGETLIAREGHVFTDGVYVGKVVYLRQEDDGANWHEIPEDQLEEATAVDYEAALEKFGVMV